jgi:hypothetical protein
MKKWILITAAVTFAVGLVLGGAYAAVAQGNTPPPPLGGFGGMVRGWMHSQAYTGTMPFEPGTMLRGYGNSQPFTGTVPFGPGGMMREYGYGQPFTGTVPFERGPMLGQGGQGSPLYGTMMLPGGVHEQVWTAVAQELGMSYDQLQAELKTKTLEQLAQEKNVKIEKLLEVYKTAHKVALDKLVQEGQLTREQADWMIQRMEQAGYPMLFGQGGSLGPCHDDDDNAPAPQGFGPYGQGRGGRGRMMPGLPGLPGRSG